MERTALLVRKAWMIKKRTTGALAKQVSVPLLGVVVLWLLYDTRETNRKKRSTKASAGYDTIHGDLELAQECANAVISGSSWPDDGAGASK